VNDKALEIHHDDDEMQVGKYQTCAMCGFQLH
jgi:hypothetical protein